MTALHPAPQGSPCTQFQLFLDCDATGELRHHEGRHRQPIHKPLAVYFDHRGGPCRRIHGQPIVQRMSTHLSSSILESVYFEHSDGKDRNSLGGTLGGVCTVNDHVSAKNTAKQDYQKSISASNYSEAVTRELLLFF